MTISLAQPTTTIVPWISLNETKANPSVTRSVVDVRVTELILAMIACVLTDHVGRPCGYNDAFARKSMKTLKHDLENLIYFDKQETKLQIMLNAITRICEDSRYDSLSRLEPSAFVCLRESSSNEIIVTIREIVRFCVFRKIEGGKRIRSVEKKMATCRIKLSRYCEDRVGVLLRYCRGTDLDDYIRFLVNVCKSRSGKGDVSIPAVRYDLDDETDDSSDNYDCPTLKEISNSMEGRNGNARSSDVEYKFNMGRLSLYDQDTSTNVGHSCKKIV